MKTRQFVNNPELQFLRVGFLAIISILLLAACQKYDLPEPPAIDTPQTKDGMIRLGRKLENPYTVENMRQAYANLVSQGVLKSGLVINATHLYIRVLPATEQEMYDFENHLLQHLGETNMELLDETISGHIFSYPLDYEILEGGTFFYDPQLPPGGITWQYTVVPVSYTMPPVRHEVLADLFLKCDFAIAEKSSRGFDQASWQLLETEALKLAGDPDAELLSQPGLKSRVPWWTPHGTIEVWDDVLQRPIPLQGAKVRARRWFRVRTDLTNNNGYFEMRSINTVVRYSIIWERRDWDIRSGTWGQAKLKKPDLHNSPWNIVINSGESLGHATIHRALIRYYYSGDRLGLKSPFYAPFWRSRLKVGYFHREQARCRYLGYGVPHFNWLTIPHVAVYGKSCFRGWLPTDTIFGITINELAHISHWDLLRRIVEISVNQCLLGRFAQLWLDRDTRIIPESWTDAVQWALTNLEYHHLGQRFNHSGAKNYNHMFGDQAWNRGWICPADRGDDDRFYTPLFIDLVDDFNQRTLWFGNLNFPNDNVSGFTLSLIENKVLPGTYDLSSLRTLLKANKPAGVTDAQIDELIDFYANL